MKWNIISDSSLDMKCFETKNPDIKFSMVPFTMLIDGKEFVDDDSLDRDELVKAIIDGDDLKSACPPPAVFEELYDGEANNIVITISSNLSGSYNSAMSAKDMFLEEHPDAKIVVISSFAAGPELALCIEDMIENIESGKTLEEVEELAVKYFAEHHTTFALCSFDNLVRNGRMNKLSYVLAKALSMWGIGVGSDEGKIEVVGKTRGDKKVVLEIIKIMKDSNFDGKKCYISHCFNEPVALLLEEKVKQEFPGVETKVLDTHGITSFYAEKEGIIVGY